jgi:hypothetical protein
LIADKSLEFEKPKYDQSRSLLRSGPASSLRINIRAVSPSSSEFYSKFPAPKNSPIHVLS